MSARAWTKDDLDREHPLPEFKDKRWSWAYDPSVGWYATSLHHTVCVDHSGDVVALYNGLQSFEPHKDVVLPVILASKGLDSLAAMAEALERRAVEENEIAVNSPSFEQSSFATGRQQGLIEAELMLRRGTVEVCR